MYVSGYPYSVSVQKYVLEGKKIQALIRESLGQFKLFKKLYNFKKYFQGLMILMVKKSDVNIESAS